MHRVGGWQNRLRCEAPVSKVQIASKFRLHQLPPECRVDIAGKHSLTEALLLIFQQAIGISNSQPLCTLLSRTRADLMSCENQQREPQATVFVMHFGITSLQEESHWSFHIRRYPTTVVWLNKTSIRTNTVVI